ncbi:TonB-dependent receptor [Qipengyuania psychrotolerans]|uniref:TonB-dependent receptor n=1 Tax=Qipengyuania psychrotolerans TaxID=2867238 RepID=A0ABX8ZKF1_9SPHN|nr:TonB-dependent receptor [Qipengyuania psychrotolerans]QZD87663.1 TonB-dependent receptor [Qipengyuania psychrotolerans]
MRKLAPVVALVCSSTIHAQTGTEPSGDSPAPFGTIIVRGERATLDIRPDEVFSEEDIAFYGFDSIGEVVDEISSRNGGSDDDIVFLVDGKRVGGLEDISEFPAEAIDQLELFPPGSAPEVGGTASQRVVNIRLKPSTSIYLANATLTSATDGGFEQYDGEFNFTHIEAPRRINLGIQVRGNGALLESERDIVQADTSSPNLGDFRTLLPENRELRLRGTISDALSPSLTAVVSTRFLRRSTVSKLGIGANGGALTQDALLERFRTNAVLTGQFDEWLVTANASYGITRRRTLTDNVLAGPKSPQPKIDTLLRRFEADLGITRPVVQLPAGPLTLTARGRFSSESIQTGGDEFTQSMRQLSGGISIPLTHDDLGPVRGIGTIDLGVDASFTDYSGIESFSNSIISLNWRPATWLRLSGSLSTGKAPPSTELLSAPVISTPGTRYFDPLSNQTVDVVAITGGSPNLLTQDDHDWRLGLEIRPQSSRLKALTADFSSTRNRNIITALPPANPLILDAFPERFERDDSGRLLAVDTRPLNFAQKSEKRLRYAFELSFPLGGAVYSENSASAGSGIEPPRRIGIPQRLQILFSHAILLDSEILVAQGFAPIDLLSPSALGLGGSGRSRHEADLTVRYGASGIGAEASARHSSAGFISAADDGDMETFRFSALSTADLRFFIEGRRIAQNSKFLSGTRFTFAIRNITNSRQDVQDSSGTTPLLYQQAYRDPTGRWIELALRKKF